MSEVLMQSKDDPTKPSLFALQLFAQDQLQKHGKLFESVEE
jgi:hypothetical protein